jgi:uncharacterized protein (TIGR03437 family)
LRLPLALIGGCLAAAAQPQLLVHDAASQTETLTGNFVMAIEENFQTRTVKSTQYLLQAPPDMLQLILADPSQVRGWPSGTPVQVTGHRAGAQFLVDSIKIVAPRWPSRPSLIQPRATSQTGIPASGQRTVALIPFTTQNQPQPIVDQPTAQAIMQEVHDYYEENSYGQLDMVSTVFPTLNLPITVECSSSDLATVWSALQPVASQSGISLIDFDSVIMIGPGNGDCVGTGVGIVGGSAPEAALVRLSIPPPLIDSAPLISHELGHHLGLYLAEMIDCGTSIIYDPRTNCSSIEFGDIADTMGFGPFYDVPKGPHFNASFKKLLGWLPPQNISTTGAYQVLPIEPTGASSLAITPPGSGDTYYVEYRQPIGSDSSIPFTEVFNGVLVHYVVGSPSSFTSYILNMHPAMSPFSGGAVSPELLPGETYVEYLNRFSLTTISVSPQSAQVLILVPGVTTPTLAFVSPTDGSTVSGAVNISIDALDRSGIVKIDLSLDGSPLTGLTAAPYTYIWNTLTGPLGKHVLEATAYNTQGASFSQQITVTVVPPQVGGLSNGASFAQSVAPGSIVSLFISGFPLPTATASTIPLPTNLGGASVTIGSGSLPFYYVSSTQINVQLPWDLPTGANTVMVSGGGASATAAFNVVPAAPGIFVWGSNQAVVQNQDLTLNQPAKPAKAGSWVTVYLTGIGPLDNPVGLGDATPAQPLSRATTAAQATVGGMAAQIYFIGMTPGLVGLAQANIQVPSTLAPGTYPIQIVMGTVASNAPLITTN